MSGLKRNLSVVTDESTDDLLKVAFATSDRTHVDQHFGSAEQFVVYGVNPGHKVLLHIAEFDPISNDENEIKLAQKLDFLKDCIAVYCRACGASAVRQLLSLGVQRVKVVEGAVIEELIEALQQELLQGPSTWLAKAITKNTLDLNRFHDMEMQGWDE